MTLGTEMLTTEQSHIFDESKMEWVPKHESIKVPEEDKGEESSKAQQAKEEEKKQ